ncbi:MAG: class I SAM-dependent methyltransferase [Candidatus Lokiarchaeota archaeon]|nr:class I SAM-dependent methyltransferase [Candidatus Lokiarchaeota archaeon]
MAQINFKKKISRCRTFDDYVDLALSFEYSLFDTLNYKSEIKSLQNKLEIKNFVKIIKKKNPKIIVEIGTCKGGTLFLLSRFSSDDALIISLDLPTWNIYGGYGYLRGKLYRSFLLKHQKLILLAKDSHKISALNEIETILKNRTIDVLFIDGDHTYKGVKQDFKMYSPLVKKDGLIVFHDIVVHQSEENCQVNEFWNEIKQNYKHQEIVDDWNQKHWGIGILYNNL